MEVVLLDAPIEETWMKVKEDALVTMGKKAVTPPTSEWKHAILRARHSPIRNLMYRFYIKDLPYFVSVHLCRHTLAQPFVKSQRNDRQSDYDRNKAPQDSPVDMIWLMNAEELMTIANKRLCMQASEETRNVVKEVCRVAEEATPELKGLLVPMCFRLYGHCDEMKPCGRFPSTEFNINEV